MKKLLAILSILLFVVTAASCSLNSTTVLTNTTSTTAATTTTASREQTIKLFSMNDFHGGTYSDIANLEQIGAYLKYQKETYENTLILSNGDIFQGAALSNYYHGEPIVEVYNNIGFDGFVLGNHEFDWGIDVIQDYADGSLENGEMSYPILAANIVYVDSQEPLENTIPYIIKEFNGVKVGVIGLIGDVIDSISASRVQNIEFLDPADTIYDYSEELRVNQNCDIVVVYIHDGSDINYEISGFTDNHYVDAIFNGHTHQSEAGTIRRSNGQPLVYAQSSNKSSSLFAGITLVYDTLENQVISGSAINYDFDLIEYESDSEIVAILDSYQNDSVYTAFVSQELATIESYYPKYDFIVATWGASVIRDYAGVDIGAVNSGGFRNALEEGTLTMGDMIEFYPFDNYIKTSRLTGTQLLEFYEDVMDYDSDVVFDDGLTYDGSHLYMNGVQLGSSTLYTIGAVDYIFDKDNYAFLDGQDITQTTLLIRDLLVEDLLATSGLFDPDNGTSFQDLSAMYNSFFFTDMRRSISI